MSKRADSAEAYFLGQLSKLTTLTTSPQLKEFHSRWDLDFGDCSTLNVIFQELGGDWDGLRAKRKTRLQIDGFLPQFNCIIEFDEKQHFTVERAKSLKLYPENFRFGYDSALYLTECNLSGAKNSQTRGGFGKPTKDFPFEGGRHAQRAFFDCLKDLSAERLGFQPTIRIPKSECYRFSERYDVEHLRLVFKRYANVNL